MALAGATDPEPASALGPGGGQGRSDPDSASDGVRVEGLAPGGGRVPRANNWGASRPLYAWA